MHHVKRKKGENLQRKYFLLRKIEHIEKLEKYLCLKDKKGKKTSFL